MPVSEVPPVDRVIELLREARDRPGERPDIGQKAAILWWQFDDAGLCDTDPPEVWEEALLAIAAWHTGDDRLRLQRADDAAIEGFLERLAI